MSRNENFGKFEFKDFLVALLKCNISNQITETDDKINQLSYKLYDLNEDEIEIVEKLK